MNSAIIWDTSRVSMLPPSEEGDDRGDMAMADAEADTEAVTVEAVTEAGTGGLSPSLRSLPSSLVGLPLMVLVGRELRGED